MNIKSRLAVGAAAFLALLSCERRVVDETIKAQVEGQWVAIEGTSNGQPAPPGYLERMTFEFKEGKYSVNDSMRMDYSIDATRSPAWIDIDNSLKQVGIIKVVDGNLHLCTGVGGERPSEFKTQAGTDQTYLVLKAKK